MLKSMRERRCNRALAVVLGLTLLACLSLLTGCRTPALNSEPEVLFTDSEGYTVKKFRYAGTTHFYVVPAGSVHVVHSDGETTRADSVVTGKK